MRITTLGTSHGSHTAQRYTSSTLIEVGETRYLIDCGEPCSATYQRLGHDFADLRALFVTHLHADHIGGIIMLTSELRRGGLNQVVDYYLPGEGIDAVRAMLLAAYIFPERTQYRLRFQAIQPGPFFYDGLLRVSAAPNEHLRSLTEFLAEQGYPHTMESYSLVLEAEGRRVVYSGDLAPDFPRLRELLSTPTDLLVMEMTHIRPEHVLPALADLPVRALLLNHVHDPWQTEEGAATIRKLADEHLPFPLAIASDGTRVEV